MDVLDIFARFLASISLALKQPLAGYCDIETSHEDALVTKQGDYLSFLRIGRMKRGPVLPPVQNIVLGHCRPRIAEGREADSKSTASWPGIRLFSS